MQSNSHKTGKWKSTCCPFHLRPKNIKFLPWVFCFSLWYHSLTFRFVLNNKLFIIFFEIARFNWKLFCIDMFYFVYALMFATIGMIWAVKRLSRLYSKFRAWMQIEWYGVWIWCGFKAFPWCVISTGWGMCFMTCLVMTWFWKSCQIIDLEKETETTNYISDNFEKRKRTRFQKRSFVST